MEARRETAIARELGGACDSVGEAAPAVGVQAQARVVDCAARVGEPLGGSLARENGVRLASVGSLEEVKRASLAARSTSQRGGSLKWIGMNPPTSARP